MPATKLPESRESEIPATLHLRAWTERTDTGNLPAPGLGCDARALGPRYEGISESLVIEGLQQMKEAVMSGHTLHGRNRRMTSGKGWNTLGPGVDPRDRQNTPVNQLI